MAAEKVASSRIRWAHAPYTDTAKAQVPIMVPTRPSFSASLNFGAHVHILPEKYEFSIILSGIRVAALDVNPTTGHYNFFSGKKENVKVTHWHTWPENNVEQDDRTLRFRQWVTVFCKRHRVVLNGFDTPPHLGGEQMRLL